MQTKLGRFNSETLQVPAKSPSSSRVTNWLIRGNKLTRALPFRNGLENKFILFKTLITMKSSSKGMSLLLILDTSSNLKKPAKDKTYIATLRNSSGLSRSDLLIISWIKVAEIGSLRLRSRALMRVKGSYLQDHSVYSSISCRCCCFFGY